ncbi:protein RRP5 homolog isoform X2 [Ornithorhynchus anatinus]|uniref:protein RRP5 homolog isoform X2 n=1 Tax=Ornithorhynchus anatinus TaxID=9258 RepID=UPI000454410B|nr:protein RRP5 homolog isoform X2 [Ornithorhynchus anatinus]
MASTDESFPRGGVKPKPDREKAVKQPLEQDNLFDFFKTHDEGRTQRRKKSQNDPKRKKTRRSDKKEPKKSDAELFELLSVQNLSEGVLLLGCVKESNKYEMVISLPNGLRGFVQATSISDTYTKKLAEQVEREEFLEDVMPLSALYLPGMLVRCVVNSIETTKKGKQSIRLSLNPKEVNRGLSAGTLSPGMLLTGTVSSREDHGYLIDIGVRESKAFLPRKKAQEYISMRNKGSELKLGQYLWCYVEEVKGNGSIVRLSIGSAEVASALATEEQNWTLDNVLPGLVVKAVIQKVTPHGLSLSFLSIYRGLVDFLHLDPKKSQSYFATQKVKACILSVHRQTKTVRLTLRPNFLHPGLPLSQLSTSLVGTVLENVPVQGFFKKAGATFKLKDGSLAFARFKHLSNSKKSFNPEKFLPGKTHKCRIIDLSPMDDLVLLSLKEKIINAPFLQYRDLQPGQLVQGKVLALRPFGVLVEVTDSIKGVVPLLHLADVQLKHPEKKFHLGDEIKGRVLSCIPSMKKLVLTLKKTLVNSDLPVITSYRAAKPQLQAHGFISKITEVGCIVGFYNNVRGLVPKGRLGVDCSEDLKSVFYLGQVIKVTVVNCSPNQERLLLSYKPMMDSEPAGSAEMLGQMVDVKVVKKTDMGLQVSILPGNVPAFLPKIHLSDHVSNSQLLWHWLQPNDILHRVLCLGSKRGRNILSRKPALICAAEEGQVARYFFDIQPGMLFTGYVTSIMDYGVFVELPFGFTGLSPRVAISDKFVTKTQDHYTVGQTVTALVTDVDEEKQRMLLSLRLSDCNLRDPATVGFSLLCQCLEELQGVRLLMKNQDNTLIQFLASLTPGLRLNLIVQEVLEGGSVTFSGGLGPGLVLSASKYHVGGEKLEPLQRVKTVVLHVDTLKLKVHVSLRPELLNRKFKKVKLNDQHMAVVQHLEKEFVIASLVETGQLVAFPIASHFNDTFRFDSEKLQLGQGVCLTLRTTEPGDFGLLLATKEPASKRVVPKPQEKLEPTGEPQEKVGPTRKPQKKVGPTREAVKKHAFSIGELVKGIVRSVKPTYIIVTLESGITGFIHVSQILDEVPLGTCPTTRLKAKKRITARVIGGKDMRTRRFLPATHSRFIRTVPELSIRPSELKASSTALNTHSYSHALKFRGYNVGKQVICFVKKYNIVEKCLEVEVSPVISGKVPHLLLSLSYKVLRHPEKKFKVGQALSAIVVGTDSSRSLLILSLTGIHKLKKGTITMGKVMKVIPDVGLTVRLPFECAGQVSIFHIQDSYSAVPLEGFKPEKIVKCCVLSTKGTMMELSLRLSRTKSNYQEKVEDREVTSLDDVKEGELLRGYVKSVEHQGVFISISSTVVGQVQYQCVSQYLVSNQKLYNKYLRKGMLLTTKVLSVNKEQNLVELSLLPQDTGKQDVFPSSLKLPLHDEEKGKGKENLTKEKKETLKDKRKRGELETKQEETPRKKKKTQASEEDEEDSGVEVYYREGKVDKEAREKPQKKQIKPAEAPRLQLSSAFAWDVGLDTLTSVVQPKEESSESEDEEQQQVTLKKKTKKDKEAEKQKAEKELSRIEATLMDPSRQPETADDFDRLVLSSPNSSILWLQYMAFHLHATEIDKARAVAERALKIISFREEQEKFNVWVALLNLENMYGSEESLTKVFERAVQYNDSLKVFLQLADIYAKSEKYTEAEELYGKMLKRFRQEKSVWLKYSAFLLRRGQFEANHQLLHRALKCLPDKDHVDVISKFAQLEFHLGDAERAKAIFESTLSNYPKRTDIWSVYIDMTIKHGSQKEVRDIFERVIHLSLAAKRMKFFFKRYLDYEKQHGSPETVQAVKEKAVEYVEGQSSQLKG